MANGISSCSEVWAKSNGESLEEHTEDALRFLRRFLEWRSGVIGRAASISGMPVEELESRLFATVYLHDIGKASPDFQDHLKTRRPNSTPHALLSLPFILAAVPPLAGQDTRLEGLAVLGHHTPFYEDLFRGYDERPLAESFYLPCAQEFFGRLPVRHAEFFGRPYPFEIGVLLLGRPTAELRLGAQGHPRKPSWLRELYALLVAALHTADWLGSSGREDYQYWGRPITGRVEAKLRDKTAAGERRWTGWHKHQDAAAGVQDDLLMRIPTGQGKTEAVLRWADHNPIRRFVYLLPTRVVSNHLFERLRSYCGDEVSISHGTSVLVTAEEAGWKREVYLSEHLYSATGLKPFLVATVDQLLLSAFHFRHWEMLTTHAAESAIIFDEIHAYDPYTTALCLEVAREFRARGARLCFMSATLPSYLEQVIRDVVGNAPLVTDPLLDGLCRHRVDWVESPIGRSVPDIARHVREGRKVLVVLDTVGEAVAYYQQLEQAGVSEEQRVLFHGRFTEKDRRRLEDRVVCGVPIDSGFVAVTTQVIEVGVDMNYELLYTQVAPLDALVQRMGRVNRRGSSAPDFPNVYVFDVENGGATAIYGEDNMARARAICQGFSRSTVTEREIRDLVERQYPHEEMVGNLRRWRQEVLERLRSVRSFLWHMQTVRLGSEDEWLRRLVSSRQQQRVSVEAIPIQFAAEVEELKNPLRAIEFQVRVPAWMARGRLRPSPNNRFLYVDLPYDPVLGLEEPQPRRPR